MSNTSVVKGGVAELTIARPDSAKDHWVYKHPDQTLPMNAQLMVDPDEVALFFKDGGFVGSLSAGRHTLDASTIPGQLIEPSTGGDIISEVFFVTTRDLASIRFGTSIGDVQDPQTRLRVRLMAHGELSVRVIDPPKLVIGLVGQRAASHEGFLGWLNGQVEMTMRDDIAALITKQGWPLSKVTSGSYADAIERATIDGCQRRIEPYGVEIIRFGDFTIRMDQADRDRLDKLVDRAAYIEGAGWSSAGAAAYQQQTQAEMMMGAAGGMRRGGGGAFEGAGVGMGSPLAGAGAKNSASAQHVRPAESREQILATLKQLGELKAAGLLTDAEFDTTQRELLARL